MRQHGLVTLVLMLGLCVLGNVCQAKEKVTVDYSGDDPKIAFAVGDIEKALKDNDKWKDIKKMGNTGLPRVFFVQTNDGEGYPFYTIKVGQDKKATMDIDYDNLLLFGIPKATADKIAADAVASASSSRGR